MRVFLTAVLVALAVWAGAPAIAATDVVDDSSYSTEEKAKAETQAAQETAEQMCDKIARGPLAGLKDECVEVMATGFTSETVPKLSAVTVCAALTGPVLPLLAACSALAITQMDTIKDWFWTAYKTALEGLSTAVAVGTFIAQAANPFEAFLNTLKASSVSFFQTVMTEITSVTAFDATAQWWRNAYAAAGAIGLFLLAVGMLLTANHYHNGRIGHEEYARSISLYPLIAVVMIIFGPAIAYVLTGVADGMSTGVISWMGTDAVEFLQDGAIFATMAPVIPGGQIMGLLLFVLLFMVMFGVLATLIVQTVSTYMVGAAGGAAWGMSSHPVWRPKALMVPMFVVGLIFARPVILFALAVAVKLANAVGSGAEGGLDMLIDAVIMIVALGMVAFAPWTLLKWFPILPDASDSARASGAGAGAAALAGVAGSAAAHQAMTPARSNSGSTGAAPTESPAAPTSSPTTAGTPAAAQPTATSTTNGSGSPASTKSAADGASTSGAGKAGAGRAGAGKAGASGAAGKAGQEGAMATAGTAAKTAAGSTGKVAAGGGKAATGAVGGAATGGALLAAQLAAQAAQAGIQKARESADAATPDVRG